MSFFGMGPITSTLTTSSRHCIFSKTKVLSSCTGASISLYNM